MAPIESRYNITGVRSSGLKSQFRKQKVQGSKSCGCGRAISANKDACRQCVEKRAA